MIASLPMYDRPETATQTGQLWQATRAQLGFGPSELSRNADLWDTWLSPDLLLSQTCGLPYRTRLHGKVQLVASPDYALPGCPAGYYNSVLITRRGATGDLRALLGQRVVINDPLSQSGHAALVSTAQHLDAPLGPIQISGAHAISAQRVASGDADIAAIDAQSWRLIQQFDPCANDLREVARTDPTPALPFITSLSQDAGQLRRALAAAIADLPQSTRDTLHLNGIATIPAAAYLAVPNPPNC